MKHPRMMNFKLLSDIFKRHTMVPKNQKYWQPISQAKTLEAVFPQDVHLTKSSRKKSFLNGTFSMKLPRILIIITTIFLFSAHIPYWKGKYLNQTVFYEICEASNLYLSLRVLPIEFDSLLLRAICICGDFQTFCSWPQEHQKDPKMTPKIVKTANICSFSRFFAIFVKFSIDVSSRSGIIGGSGGWVEWVTKYGLNPNSKMT